MVKNPRLFEGRKSGNPFRLCGNPWKPIGTPLETLETPSETPQQALLEKMTNPRNCAETCMAQSTYMFFFLRGAKDDACAVEKIKTSSGCLWRFEV